MNRRAYLALAASVAVSGCLGGSTEESLPPSASGDDLAGFDPGETAATVAVGTREDVRDSGNNRPHGVSVWNDADRSRTVAVTADRKGGFLADTGSVLDGEFRRPADEALDVSLREPGAYAVSVAVPDENVEADVSVPEDRFDCNASSTRVRIGPDGEVEWAVLTTLAACSDGDLLPL